MEYKHRSIRKLGTYNVNENIILRERIHFIRELKNVTIIIVRNKLHSIQLIVAKDVRNGSELSIGDVVDFYGVLRSCKEVKATSVKNLELHVERYEVVSKCNDLPFTVEESNNYGQVGLSKKLDNRVVDLRTELNQSIFTIRSYFLSLFREYLHNKDFMEINTPKLIGNKSEGGAQVFHVPYFESQAYLAQSPQLYKQMMINSDYGRVFEIGPVFRAENSGTKRHLCEFTGLDIEMELGVGKNHNQVINVIWKTLLHIFNNLSKYCENEISYVRSKVGSVELEYPNEPLCLTFLECVQLLKESGYEQNELEDLSTENERKMGEIVKEKYGSDIFVITQYPTSCRPFYTKIEESNSLYSNSFDIIMRGTEISSGAQREHNYEALVNNMERCGVSAESLKDYLVSFKYGSKPHGGCGIGLERLIYLYLGLEDVRNACLFPRDPKRLFP
ncbi:Aspartyl-tRNA synthetase [Orpheovirus IHUMI-LCC2]|uniref:Aspartyl-tRNA synthetase n=1 Tax=Orpheovirus IHUMI-LCC2 TaxID=2023057 RepID=A0A2I2L4Y8_9VIRU|nr:Aspartyl-tRNA synthetase [Orpheovirus IHUMI-LCC2]SNW62586.1 Aspartyl-tRNA synthetase [Orpheovirus IHUMI-LCC2]